MDLDVPLGSNLVGWALPVKLTLRGFHGINVLTTKMDRAVGSPSPVMADVVFILPERIAPNKAFEFLLERFECLKDLLGALFHFRRLITPLSRGRACKSHHAPLPEEAVNIGTIWNSP